MKVAIDQIKVDETVRIRQEVGTLKALEESIAAVGLLNPIIIDEQYNLVAGFRRLAACRNLKMTEVDVRVVDFGGDPLKMLDVEVAENFFRKDFTPGEILATEKRRQEILEARREKGLFERFWLWLKSLFGKPSPPAATAVSENPRQSANVAAGEAGARNDGEQPEEEAGGKEADEEPSEDAREEAEEEPSEETAARQSFSSSQNDRSIRWRES